MAKKTRFQKDVDALDRLAGGAWQIIAVVLATGLAVTFIQTRIGISTPIGWAAWISLVTSTIVIIGAWLIFPRQNLAILAEWFHFRPHQTTEMHIERLVPAALAVALAVMILTASWPIVYASIYLLYCGLYLLGVRHLNSNIGWGVKNQEAWANAKALEAATPTKREYVEAAIKVIEEYHLNRPHEQRIIVMGAVGIVAWCLALASLLTGIVWGNLAAAFLLSATLICAEIIISVWRNEYYGKMNAIRDERDLEAESRGP